MSHNVIPLWIHDCQIANSKRWKSENGIKNVQIKNGHHFGTIFDLKININPNNLNNNAAK